MPAVRSTVTKAGEYLEDIMKKLALAAAFGVAATSAMAGSYAKDDVVMEVEPVVVVEETQASSSSAALLIPLLLIAIVAAAAAD